MKSHLIFARLIALVIGLHSCFVIAEEPKESEVEQLRARVADLESSLRAVKAILSAKEVLPPHENITAATLHKWTDVFIKVDAGSVIWMNGGAVEDKAVISALLEVYKAGKFPFLMIEKH